MDATVQSTKVEIRSGFCIREFAAVMKITMFKYNFHKPVLKEIPQNENLINDGIEMPLMNWHIVGS